MSGTILAHPCGCFHKSADGVCSITRYCEVHDPQSALTEEEKSMVREAWAKFGENIGFCKNSWKESFMVAFGERQLYFNLESLTTRVISRPAKEGEA